MPLTRRAALSGIAAAGALGGLVTRTGARSTGRSSPCDPGAVPGAVFRRRIPKTGELVPAIGLGTARTFNADPAGDLGPLIEVVRIFLAAGGAVIDSSPMYGRSEEVVGRILAGLGRTDLFYATKVWTDKGKEAGVEQMETSMRLMGTKVMDLMQVHNLVGLKAHMPTLRDMKTKRTIRYLGVTEMKDFETVERLMKEESLDFIQIPYSMDDRRVEDRVLPAARDTGTAVLVMTPFGAGRLFGKVKDRPLPGWASEIDCESWSQVFLKFILAHPAVTCPIPATSKPEHMLDNMRAGSGRLPDESLRKRMLAELEG